MIEMLALSALFLLYVFYREYKKSRPIVDNSNGVVHIIYPKGRRVSKEMMDPNIGGYKPKEDKIGFAAINVEDDDYKGPITPFIRPIK